MGPVIYTIRSDFMGPKKQHYIIATTISSSEDLKMEIPVENLT